MFTTGSRFHKGAYGTKEVGKRGEDGLTLVYIGDWINTDAFLLIMGWVIVGLTVLALFIPWAEKKRRESLRE